MSEIERLIIFIQEMSRFSERMAEERAKRGHITYPDGAVVHPSAWPACPPDCEHLVPVKPTLNTAP